jgi:hypothetical protein
MIVPNHNLSAVHHRGNNVVQSSTLPRRGNGAKRSKHSNSILYQISGNAEQGEHVRLMIGASCSPCRRPFQNELVHLQCFRRRHSRLCFLI